MTRNNTLQWHFLDYPTTNDPVLAKTTDGDLMIAVWDVEKHVWYDLGRDWDWFGSGIACWAYVTNVPETLKAMPAYRDVCKKLCLPTEGCANE